MFIPATPCARGIDVFSEKTSMLGAFRGDVYITWFIAQTFIIAFDQSFVYSTSRQCPPPFQTTLPCNLGSLRLSRRRTVSEGWPDPVEVTDFGLFIQLIGLILHPSILPRPKHQRVAPSKSVWRAMRFARKGSFM